jgi:hypothetical protein
MKNFLGQEGVIVYPQAAMRLGCGRGGKPAEGRINGRFMCVSFKGGFVRHLIKGEPCAFADFAHAAYQSCGDARRAPSAMAWRFAQAMAGSTRLNE